MAEHTSFRSPPSLWLRQHVSVPGSESFRSATRYFKWSLGRSVVIALRWNIGRLFLAAAYSSTTISATLRQHLLLFIGSLSHSMLAGVAAKLAYSPKNTTYRLRHPPATFFFPLLFHCFFPSYLLSPDPRLIVRSSRLSRVLSIPTQLIVNYPWMSYAHPTLILKLSKKNPKCLSAQLHPTSKNIPNWDEVAKELRGPLLVRNGGRLVKMSDNGKAMRKRSFRWKTRYLSWLLESWNAILYLDYFSWSLLINSFD